MAAEKVSVTALVAEALLMQRQHQARERFLKEALSGIAPEEVERRTADAYREIFGRPE
jgi:hypothetical protein